MDINLLRSKMALKGDTQADLADVLDITPQALSSKMTQSYDFKQSEINIIAKRYDLTGDEIKQIFFNSAVVE